MVGLVRPVVPAACSETVAAASLWKCAWPSFRMPRLQTPYWTTWSQFDSFQLGGLMGNYAPSTPQQFGFAESYQLAVLNVLSQVRARVRAAT